MEEIRIVLDREQFRDLVRGKIAVIETRSPRGLTVKIALKDIGWQVMGEEIAQAAMECAGRAARVVSRGSWGDSR